MGNTILLGENYLEDADFLSADEQDGEYIGQPDPASGNRGGIRVISSGDIADATITGTTDSDGNVGGTTFIDSTLDVYGTTFFYGATVTIGGEDRVISFFSRSTGTVTVSVAFSAQVTSATAYSIALPFEDLDFELELVGAGDLGEATFKWLWRSTTFIGRNDPSSGGWVGLKEIDDAAGYDITETTPSKATMIQEKNNGAWVVVSESAVNTVEMRESYDNGRTWTVGNTESGPVKACCAMTLRSGRMVVYTYTAWSDTRIVYTDVSPADWTSTSWVNKVVTIDVVPQDCLELSGGGVLVVGGDGSVDVCISNDGGFSFSSAVVVDANGQFGALCEDKNGRVICAYSTDADSAGDFEIKCKISDDGGATWGSAIDVADFVAVDLSRPSLVTDINGDIYCAFHENNATETIDCAVSSDNGETWAPQVNIEGRTGIDIDLPVLSLMDGHQLVCCYVDKTNDDIDFVLDGYWTNFSANACPVPINGIKQRLLCGVDIKWIGAGGFVGDEWTFEPEYQFAMENIIHPSPSKKWKATTYDAAHNIVIDMGANVIHAYNAVALFGCNIRTVEIQSNATDSWGAPTLDETVSFDIATGLEANGADVGNAIKFVPPAGLAEHEWAGKFCRFTDTGYTWFIMDNIKYDATDHLLFLGTDMSTPVNLTIADEDPFVVFGPNAYKTFTLNTLRYTRILIPSQRGAGYYPEIGTVILSNGIPLTRGWSPGYGKTNRYLIEHLRSPAGGVTSIKRAERKRIFNLTWKTTETTRNEVLSMIDYISGKPIGLVPDDDDTVDVYVVSMVSGEINSKHVFQDKWALGPITFEEIL